MSTRQIYQMRVERILDHARDIRQVFFSCIEPKQFVFKAGQFATLQVPSSQPGGKPTLRAYSIASEETKHNGFSLIFKAVPNGVATTYIWSLKGDETVNFTGPFGRVFFKEPPTEQIVFLNTGSGISQHYCFLKSKAALFTSVRYRLLFGVRSEEDIYFRSELDELKNTLSDFNYEYVLSRPSPSWTGKKGYVQNFIEQFDYLKIPTTFYLCGNGAMIKETKKFLIETQGMDPKSILSEAFD